MSVALKVRKHKIDTKDGKTIEVYNPDDVEVYVADVERRIDVLIKAVDHEKKRADDAEAKVAETALFALIRVCRNDAGTCRMCGAASSTMHNSECPVLTAIHVLEPSIVHSKRTKRLKKEIVNVKNSNG